MLGQWISDQQKNSKHPCSDIMKNEIYYNKWTNFKNSDKYKNYFNLNNVKDWKNNLKELIQFIDLNNCRPQSHNNSKLCNWTHTQNTNYKQKISLLKIEEIYNIWTEFINDAKYKKYFDLDNVRDWKTKLEDLKNFIDTNKFKPIRTTHTQLAKWLSRQLNNYKQKIQIMKTAEIYQLWTEFITDARYKQYFT
jgi:hypothetical protein